MKSHGTLSYLVESTRLERVVNNLNVTNGVVTEIRKCDWSNKDAYTPALNSAYAGNANYLLNNAVQERLPGDLAKITLTYATKFDALPSTTVTEQSSQIECDIREHPMWSDWASEWDEEAENFIPTSTKYGIKSYIKGTTTVTVTEYFDSKPSSLRASIGKRSSPGGDYGSANNWLIIGSTRQQQGVFWTRSTTYLYSAKVWDSDIYGT